MNKINKKYSKGIAKAMLILSIAMLIGVVLLFSSCESKYTTVECQGVVISKLGKVKDAEKKSLNGFYQYKVKEDGNPEYQLLRRPTDMYEVGDTLIWTKTIRKKK